MPDVTLPLLLTTLKEAGFDVVEQKETDQLYILFKIADRDFPLFIKICQEGELIQLLIFIPTNLTSQHQVAVGRLLHFLNKNIDLPGFGMDEENKVIFYRLMMPSYDKQFSKEVLRIYLSAAKIACESFAALIQAVNMGLVKVEEAMLQMEQNPPE